MESTPLTESAIPCFFHPDQLSFKPVYEWSFGEKIAHPEVTARAENILAALNAGDAFEVVKPGEQPIGAIRDVHSYELLTLYNTARKLEPDVTFYPSVFPRDLRSMGDPTNIRHAGCYCFDSGTPLNAKTFDAAAWSAACAFDGADRLAQGTDRLVYALSRPPGHHATSEFFGGYSYFNNTVIAARRLSEVGRVAIVDIDFHHGNGTQSIFYDDPSVLTISLHGDPTDFYPFYCGYPNETGEADGGGYNLNFCLPRGTGIEAYSRVLASDVLNAVSNFGAEILIVAAGFDGYALDPIGAFDLQTDDFHTIGSMLGGLHLPTLVVQEGGYYTRDLGANVVSFLSGVREGLGAAG